MLKRIEMQAKHPLAIRWCHWINFPLLALMIWSGLWIYWANDVYRLGLGSFTLLRFFPDSFYKTLGVNGNLAKGMAWHFLFMWFFALNGVVYLFYTIFSGEWRYLVPSRQSFREAVLVMLHDLGLYKGSLPVRKFKWGTADRLHEHHPDGAGSVLTGVAIYKPTQFAWLTSCLGAAARFVSSISILLWVMCSFS